ncbi:hypothetical protein LPB72_10555 [Hydrogenophaga crassostreae]|uniref:Uncharacterized protein n=1 Tax=Hydrogenophaga crassostreae TaxID=1763535 RepID=A0A163CF01_9BURK|nr:hypothetical protein [Hydrogenophaga crassostreae]AOW13457.1 hypothetical protein LPB072_11930 [Hydrogenophaga crassostreae]OAD41748.1 hypothetical protein LPB72_10555 [Hydrogenophaga crassostreae]
MSETTRPTATGSGGVVPRFGMYAGPNYAGGRSLHVGELPTAEDWQVRPIGFLDDVTRDHDINYTYIEKVYQGNDATSKAERTLALWQADKEMLGNMLGYQPTNWLEGQYRDAAIKAFVAKADTSYRPAVDVVSEWNRDLAGIDPKFPALNASESGRAQWSLPSLVHAGATYTSTGMQALSTSGVNSQVAMMFNEHIKPRHIDPLNPSTRDNAYPELDRDDSHRILVPQRDHNESSVFTAEGNIDGRRIMVWYDQEAVKLTRTVYNGDSVESKTTYKGEKAAGTGGERYGYADFDVTRQEFVNGQSKADPVKLPSVKAPETPELKESDHTRAIKPNVEQGHSSQYPAKPTAEDRAWHSGTTVDRAAPSPEGPNGASSASPLSPISQSLLETSERHVRQVAEQHGLPWNTGLSNTAHAIAASARGQGMSDINLFRVADGQIRYGQLDGAMLKDGVLDARQAANQPMTDSLERLGQLDQQQQQDQLATRRVSQSEVQQTRAHEPLMARAV